MLPSLPNGSSDAADRFVARPGQHGQFNERGQARLSDVALVGLTKPNSIWRILMYFRCAPWNFNWQNPWPAVDATKDVEMPTMVNMKDPSIDITPMPSHLRELILGAGGAGRWGNVQTWAMTLIQLIRFAGVGAGLFAALMLQGEAAIIREYGISRQAAEQDVYGYAYNGWTWLYVSYTMTGLTSFMEATIGAIFIWGGIAAQQKGGVPEEVRAWFATSPELEFLPFGMRQIGFCVADLLFGLAIYAARGGLFMDEAYNVNPNIACFNTEGEVLTGVAHVTRVWPGFEHYYQARGKNIQGPLLVAFMAALLRLITLLVDAVVWSGLNFMYIFPCARCNTEVFGKETISEETDMRESADHRISLQYFAMQDCLREVSQLYEAASAVPPSKIADQQMYIFLNEKAGVFRQSAEKLVQSTIALQSEKMMNSGEDATLLKSFEFDALNALQTQAYQPQAGTMEELVAISDDLAVKMARSLTLLSNSIPDRIEIGTLYTGPKVFNQGVVSRDSCKCLGIKCGGCCSGCAALTHNYLGALRTWSNLASLLMFIWVFLVAQSGMWGGLFATTSQRYSVTWPVYIPDALAIENGDTPFLFTHLRTFIQTQEQQQQEQLQQDLQLTDTFAPPTPSMMPPSPPADPYDGWFPPPECHSLKGDAVSGYGDTIGDSITWYPEYISRANDASHLMIVGSNVLFAAQLLRLIGTFAQLLGYIRNEASIPGSHTRRYETRNSCWRAIWP